MPITTLTRKTRLVRGRNPWGNAAQYNGGWSDVDLGRWKRHPDVAKALNFMPAPDGTWWMDFESFASAFGSVSISESNMAKFDPPPAHCNTDWGATRYLPGGPLPTPLDWKGAQQQP